MDSSKLTYGIIIFISAIMLIPAVPYQKAFANGGFQGDFAPENWTLQQNGENGSVNTQNAPFSITLFGADYQEEELACDPNFTGYEIVIPSDGIMFFDFFSKFLCQFWGKMRITSFF